MLDREGGAVAEFFVDLRCGFLCAFAIDVGAQDLGAFLCEAATMRAAQTLRCAGHQRQLAFYASFSLAAHFNPSQ